MQPKYLEQDVSQRLNKGVIFYKEEPYFVNSVYDSGQSLVLLPLKNLKSKGSRVATNDTNIDVSSKELGYINFNAEAVYVRRIPLRRYKQSISPEALEGYIPSRNNSSKYRGSMRNLVISAAGHSMFVGSYPKIDNALKSIASGVVRSIAISRNVALSINQMGIVYIYYKTDQVGYLDVANSKVLVPSDEFAYIISKHLSQFGMEIG